MNQLNQAEIAILDAIQEHIACPFLDAVFPVITMLGEAGIFWILTAVVLLFFKKTRRAGISMGLALIMGLLIGNLCMKPLFARIRPYDVNPAVTLLIDQLSDYSFPSGHTLASFEAAGVLMIAHRKTLGYPALAIAVLVALSRLYLYVHYPTDVLTSVVLGLIFAAISWMLIGLLYKKFGWQDGNTPVKSTKQ